MIVIGLTGSIAMGKSAAAAMFAELGVPVFDSDAVVHREYAAGGSAVDAIARLFPGAIVDGAVDRHRLAAQVLGQPERMNALEAAVHPIIRRLQDQFLANCRRRGDALAVLDIPLLFETGRDRDVDRIVVVSAPADVQMARAMSRPGMTAEKLDRILARQTPDSEKRRRAHYVVDTSQSPDHARAQVHAIVAALRAAAGKD